MELICLKKFALKLQQQENWWFFLPSGLQKNSNKSWFFEEMANSLNKIKIKYDNIILTRDLKIHLLDKSKKTNKHLSDLCHNFSLKDLLLEKTYFKSHEGTLLDIMLTSRPKRFDSTNVIETGPSDCQKLIASFFNAYFKKLPPKIIEY